MSSKFTIKLDKDRSLRFSFSAIVRLEQDHGINVFKPETYRDFSPRQTAALVWAAQLGTPDPLSFQSVLEHIPMDPDGFLSIVNVVGDALVAALDKKQDVS